LNWLAVKALGWLGWTEDQLMDADLNAILVAYRGRVEMLKAIFGSSDDDSGSTKTPKPKDFKAFSKEHNRKFQIAKE
jgi:hypothetical protein